MNSNILIVEDDEDMAKLLDNILKIKGYSTKIALNGKKAWQIVQKFNPNLIVADINIPKINGMDLLEKVQERFNHIQIIMITAYSDIKEAVKAMKLGAFNYIQKPFDNEELLVVIEKALTEQRLQKENKDLKIQLGIRRDIFVGESESIQDLIKQVKLIAPTNFSVIIHGETGTGKELLARMIHNKSNRENKIFAPVDCSTIPENLIESELFGHEKGAFTDANGKKIGKFEVANGGTLFLDEISNLTLKVQAKLLRAIEEKQIYRIGKKQPIKTDIRIIAATNMDLGEMIKHNNFREDLFHRLDQFYINIPSLNEREDDIPRIAHYFMKKTSDELGKHVDTFTSEAIRKLMNHSWSGNVRELKNVINKAVLLSSNNTITSEDICFSLEKDNMKKNIHEYNLKKANAKMEKRIIEKVLNQEKGNKTISAKRLGISRKNLYSKIQEYNFDF